MDSLLRDQNFAVRSLLKHSGIAAFAVLTVVPGSAANAIRFSAEDTCIRHPFSFPNQQRLRLLWKHKRPLRRTE
jgi:hypothetical protein